MNDKQLYDKIRLYTLSYLRWPPPNMQLFRYGDLTSEEILNEVFLSVWQEYEDWWEDALLRTAVSRRLIDLFRLRQSSICEKVAYDTYHAEDSSFDGVDDYLDLLRVWDTLSAEEQQLLSHRVMGFKFEDIAASAGKTPGACRVRVHYLRNKLSSNKE